VGHSHLSWSTPTVALIVLGLRAQNRPIGLQIPAFSQQPWGCPQSHSHRTESLDREISGPSLKIPDKLPAHHAPHSTPRIAQKHLPSNAGSGKSPI
jgi:hypothetical protein